MPRYLIERHIPGAGELREAQLREIAAKSKCALEQLPGYIWHETLVTADRMFCIHEAPSEQVVREHSRRGGFPIAAITEIRSVFGPQSAATPAHAAR